MIKFNKKKIAGTSILCALFFLFFQKEKIIMKYEKEMRKKIYNEIKPIIIKDCGFKRFGGENDGGYLLCENYLKSIEVAYSYGISGEDRWGCEIAKSFQIPVYEYDCFDKSIPICEKSQFLKFNEECLAGQLAEIENRKYGTLEKHISENKDNGKKLVLKLDIEGDEWEALQNTSEQNIEQILQMVVEFHDVEKHLHRNLKILQYLKEHFYIVNVHFNNYTCRNNFYPLPASTFQILMVNKNQVSLQNLITEGIYSNPLDKPDNPSIPDCQANWGR